MDKLIFLFRRKQGLTRKEFFDHYLDVHAPLGKRVTQTMRGYTVNLVDTEGGLDAVTEIWTESAADFMDPAKSFATPEDAAELMADHDSFLGPFEAYVVEEKIVSGEVPDAPLGAVGPSGAQRRGHRVAVRRVSRPLDALARLASGLRRSRRP